MHVDVAHAAATAQSTREMNAIFPSPHILLSWPEYDTEHPFVMDLGTAYEPEPLASPEKIEFWKLFFSLQKAW
jgi:hypothetical protein